MKSKKHKVILEDYEKSKSKHLEKLASDMIKKDDYYRSLRKIELKEDFFNKLFSND